MSKAAKIRELYAQGLTTRQIADRVGCRTEYVRVAARQRVGGGESNIDIRYRTETRRLCDREAARSAGRAAWEAAKISGGTAEQKSIAYWRAYYQSTRKTGAAARRSCRKNAETPTHEARHVGRADTSEAAHG